MGGNGLDAVLKTTKEEEKLTEMEREPDESLELQAILGAIDRYVEKYKRNVCVAACFIAFDEEKAEKEDEDIAISGSSMTLAFGSLRDLRVVLNELRDFVEDEQEDEFVNF